MEVYNCLLDKVAEYLSEKPVEDTNEVVSAYTLWTAIEKEVHDIKYVLNDNSHLLEFVNHMYRDLWTKDKDAYYKALEGLDVKVPLFKPLQFQSVTSRITSDGTSCITFLTTGSRLNARCVDLYKDINDDNYYGRNINDYLIRYCKPELDRMFEVLEFYHRLNKTDERDRQFLSNSVMEIDMHYPLLCNTYIDVRLNRTVDPNNSQAKKYFEKPVTIKELINNQQDVILKNTPVKIKDLNHFCSMVIKKYLKEQKDKEQKVLTYTDENKK